jgi:hypothetical protein
MTPATYGGFGLAAFKVSHVPQATAQQVSAFFGVSGTQSIFGGARGRTFMVEGVIQAANVAAVRALEASLLTYADGIPRDLVDTAGATWSNVVFRGEFQRQGDMGYVIGGYGQPYRAVFYGLL